MKCYVCCSEDGEMEEAINARGQWAHKSTGACVAVLQARIAALERALKDILAVNHCYSRESYSRIVVEMVRIARAALAGGKSSG